MKVDNLYLEFHFRGETMLPLKGLAYRRMADTTVGHLIYVIEQDGLDLALCVEHPTSGAGGAPQKVALRLLGGTRFGRMPIVDTTVHHCIDWGIRPIVQWQHPLAMAPRSHPRQLDAGYILLTGDQPGISSHHSDGRGDCMYWNVHTGKPVIPGDADFVFLTQWALGVNQADGTFTQFVAYPDHYGPKTLTQSS